MRLLLGRKPLDHLALTANRACIQESYRTIAKKDLNGIRTPQPPAPLHDYILITGSSTEGAGKMPTSQFLPG